MTVTIILSWTGQDAATVRAAISIKDDLVGPASLSPPPPPPPPRGHKSLFNLSINQKKTTFRTKK